MPCPKQTYGMTLGQKDAWTDRLHLSAKQNTEPGHTDVWARGCLRTAWGTEAAGGCPHLHWNKKRWPREDIAPWPGRGSTPSSVAQQQRGAGGRPPPAAPPQPPAPTGGGNCIVGVGGFALLDVIASWGEWWRWHLAAGGNIQRWSWRLWLPASRRPASSPGAAHTTLEEPMLCTK